MLPSANIQYWFNIWKKKNGWNTIIVNLCKNGCYDSLEYMHTLHVIRKYYSQYYDEHKLNMYYISPYTNINYMFLACCQYGQQETAQWLISYNKQKMDLLTSNDKEELHKNTISGVNGRSIQFFQK